MKEVKRTKSVPSRNDARAANGARHRKRRKRSYTLYYLLLLFFVLISGITLSVTVFFNIDTITVEGVKRYTAQQIIDQSGIKKGNNLFRISPEKGEKKIINALKDIDSVKIERKFPSGLKITVSESVPTYYWDNNGSYILVSEGGRILKTDAAQEETADVIRLLGFDGSKLEAGGYLTAENNDRYELLEKLTAVLRENKLDGVTQIDLTSDVSISVQYLDRVEIKFGSMSELSYKVKFAKNVLETKLEENEEGVIDATTPGKVYYTPGSIHVSSSAVSSDSGSSGEGPSSNAGGMDSSGVSSGTSSRADVSSNTVASTADTSHR